MNNLLTYMALLALLLSGSSCHRNRLKTSEKELVMEMQAQEKEKIDAEKTALDKIRHDSLSNYPAGFRYRENRSVDPERPPFNIDIICTRNNLRNFKLSDIANSVRYVKLEIPPDTLLLNDPFYSRSDLISSVSSDDERLIFQGLFGLTSFDMNGKYQETIWKNETGINFYGGSVMYGGQDFIGILPHIPVSQLNENIYFDFNDGPAGKGLVMKFKSGSTNKISAQTGIEIPQQKPIPCDTLLNIHKFSNDRFERIYGINSGKWAGVNNKWNSGKSGTLLVIHNDSGDTICTFSDYERIEHFTQTTWRHSVGLESYYYKGLLTIKSEYNDTIFRLIPPNRLLPVYTIDFGENKVKYMDGLNPEFDLSDKYILRSLRETDKYLFIKYTQNYDSPANVRKNAVKFYTAIFNKKEEKLYHQSGFTLVSEGIKNDLDCGMPFWPEFITPQGEMMRLISGKNMKDYINSEQFKNGNLTVEQRKQQASLVSGLKDTDMIIMIVK